MKPQAIIVIPARLASTRLPRKMLLAETGKPLIQHTVEAAGRSVLAEQVVVGTEDPEIAAAVSAFGGKALLMAQHPSGTDRVAEVATHFAHATIIVNLQGDEPEIAAADIDLAIELLLRHESVPMATLATPIREQARLDDPACVKVVCDRSGKALWFSRSPIPYVRDRSRDWLRHQPPVFLQHLGLYAYRADFLQQIPHLPTSDLEQAEGLEQLRILVAGYPIQVATVADAHKGIDSPDDYRRFVERTTGHHRAGKLA